MSLLDAVKKFISNRRVRAKIERSRQAWIRSDMHKFRSPGMETLKKVGDEIRAMDERLERLRKLDRSKK